jgi:hypothetical protein
MRTAPTTKKGCTVRAVAGTHVVFLAFDLTDAARDKCLGFAIKRADHDEQEEYWLQGQKTFESVRPHTAPGEKFSTHEHPIQGMQWADYSAKPNHSYTYTVIPMYGTPAALEDGTAVSVDVTTEDPSASKHSIHFNRGAVASQEYARRFENKWPSVIGPAAYEWLSRGVEEALIEFIGRAKNSAFSLRAAIYEFQWHSVLQAFKKADADGADVQVIYDAIASGKARAKNKAAIQHEGVGALCKGRSEGKIMHNKFIVLLKNDKPISVLTGSTNVTENGIFGHLNCVHVVEDKAVAAQYLAYWEKLEQNPTTAELKDWADANNPSPPDPWTKDLVAVFSPQRGLDVLKWYAAQAEASAAPLMITLAFGMHSSLQHAYELPDGVLRMAMMEKEGNGAGLKQGKIDVARIRKLDNVLVAIGNYVTANKFDTWLKEKAKENPDAGVLWVHTKFLLIDPLGKHPVVMTGSANFSEASTNTNDENMLVIRNEPRVADIYFTEFLRIYTHHAFRESLARHAADDSDDWRPQYLKEKARDWQKVYFTPGNESYLRRLYFAR